MKQSETLLAWRTFNNATKARIRGCLLCHAIARGDGTRRRRGGGGGGGGKREPGTGLGKILTEKETCVRERCDVQPGRNG